MAESSETVGAGRVQLELGTDVEVSGSGEQRVTSLRTPLKLRIGIIDRLEAHVETDGVAVDLGDAVERRAGFSDLDLGVKVHLYGGGGLLPSVGVLLAVTVPSGSRPGAGGTTALHPTVAADWEVTAAWGVGLNLGFSAVLDHDPGRAFGGEGEQAEEAEPHAARFALAVGRTLTPLTDALRAYVEVFGELPVEGGEHQVSLDGGLSWLVNPHVQLDLAARGGLTEAAPDFGVGLGVSVRH